MLNTSLNLRRSNASVLSERNSGDLVSGRFGVRVPASAPLSPGVTLALLHQAIAHPDLVYLLAHATQ